MMSIRQATIVLRNYVIYNVFGYHKTRLKSVFNVLQVKTKEERQLRYQNLQMTHRHICDMVGIYLGIDSSEVLDGVADDELHLVYFDEFLSQRQRKSLMFYYQDGPYYPIGRQSILGHTRILLFYVTNR